MRNWIGSLTCLVRSLSAFVLLFTLSLPRSLAQDLSSYQVTAYELQPSYANPGNWYAKNDTVETAGKEDHPFPDPNAVMYKSMIVPGWGQIQNRQIWKVPIIYGLLGGLAWYSIQLTHSYHDYRAAYYNLNPNTPDDMRFGPTPAYIPENSSLEAIRQTRNSYRNRRDFIYVALGLAYGLNIIDAYVFAHMRSFDVSEDLSMRTTIQPAVMAQGGAGLTLSVQLFNKNKVR